MNKVTLIGRLSKEPILRYTQGEETKAMVSFNIAVTKRFKTDEADFFNCVSFGKTAETIAKHFHKGKQIAVIGRLQTGSYEKNGQKHYTTDILIEEFYFTGNKNDSSGEETKEPDSQETVSTEEPYTKEDLLDDEDLPF